MAAAAAASNWLARAACCGSMASSETWFVAAGAVSRAGTCPNGQPQERPWLIAVAGAVAAAADAAAA
eukprot:COSAG02_NODE_13005_length_1462_cov_0.920763_1_plen_66_part_10